MSEQSNPGRVRGPIRRIPPGLERLEGRRVPTILVVGMAKGDLTFAQAAAEAQDGDTVEVQAGTYANFDVKWAANNLTIEAVNGPVILDDAGYVLGNQKGIFDVVGNDALVRGLTFENAHDFGDDGHNYAGIRDDGTGLTVDACTFLNNDDGLLVTPPGRGVGDVLVSSSVFSNDGYGDGESHNMYINHVHSFTLESSSTADANVGHDVKSRALNTYLLYNFIGDSGSGPNDQASLVDLPDGGNSYLVGNVLHKGPGAANGTMIDTNLEGYDDGSQENPSQLLEAVNNTVVNDRRAGTDVLAFGPQTTPVNLVNNIFAGAGEGGTTTYSGQNGAPPNSSTDQTNLRAANPGFADASAMDYRPTSGSAAIDAGSAPGSIDGVSLAPTNEYVAVASTQSRPVEGPLDIGAYEFVPAGNQPPTVATPASASTSTVTGKSVNLGVLGADDRGESSLSYSWSVASGPGGVTFSLDGTNAAKNTTATFTQAGSYTFEATITDQGGLSVTSTSPSVTVEQAPTALALSPPTSTVADGATRQFSATATDQFGNAIGNPALTWSLSGPGTVSTSGLYTAPATGQGNATVTATSGAVANSSAVTFQAPGLAQGGFEAPIVGKGRFVYDPTGSAWTFDGSKGNGSGLAANGSGLTASNPDAPQGVQVAFLQRAGAIAQEVDGWAAGSYTISFDAAQRENSNRGLNAEDFEVLVDGAVVGRFKPSSGSYQADRTGAFTVAAGSHAVEFLGLDTVGGDNTALLDAVSVASANLAPPPPPTPGDAGFEQVPVGTGRFVYDPTGSAWTFDGSRGDGSGLAGNGSGLTASNPDAPQGDQVAFLQRAGAIAQEVDGWAAGSYTISFDAAQRANFGTSLEDFEVLVDGAVVGTFRPATTTYQAYSTAAFAVGEGSHAVEFLGLNTVGGDNTALLDSVTIVPQITPAFVGSAGGSSWVVVHDVEGDEPGRGGIGLPDPVGLAPTGDPGTSPQPVKAIRPAASRHPGVTIRVTKGHAVVGGPWFVTPA